MGIYNSLPIVARALSSQIGLNVSVGGNEAYATETGAGFLINLPFFKDAEMLANPLLGYAVHEAAHIRFTDFGDLKIFIQEHMESDKYNVEVLRHLVNLCEDLRIERAMSCRYPGTLKYLNSLNHFLFSEEAESCDKASSVFLDTLLTCGLNRFNGLTIPTKQVREDFERIFGLELYDKAMTVMAEAVQATSIKKVFEVACRLYDLAVDAFNETNEQEEPPQDDNQGADYGDSKGDDSSSEPSQSSDSSDKNGDVQTVSSGGNGGSPSSSAGQNGPSSDPDGNTGGAPDKEHGQNDSDDENDNSSSTSANRNTPASDSGDNKAGASQPGSNASGEASVVNMSQGGKDPFEGTTSNDLGRTGQNTSDKLNQLIKDKVPPHQRIVSPTPYSVAPAKRHDTGNASVSLGVQMATGLRQSLHGLLQGVRAVRRTHRETGRKLDSRLVTSAMLGNTRLFKHKSKAVDVSSAFTILLDSSGSMSRSVKEAEAAVVSMLYALDGIQGVTTSAYHFPHAAHNSVGLLKGREQTLRTAIGTHQFGIGTQGCTPLCESLWPALADLTSAKADRHVLVIATDGQPDDMASARAMIQSAKDDDIIVIGIGFGDASDHMMKSLFGDIGVSVGSVSALRSKLFEVTRKALMS